jgi:sugar/nucleoside kinase (ribokinase family)
MENGFSFLQQGTTVGAIQPSELTYTTEPHEKNIFIYGSISTTLPSAGEILLEHAKQSRKDGLIYFDLNARPSVINEMDDYTGLVDRWAGIADVVKASDYDVSSAYGEISFREVAQRWIDAGAKLAIITSGNKGCWALTSSGVEVQIGAKKLNTPYTVGAGDSFNAGVALELVRSISAQDFRDIKWDPSLLERILLAGNRSASLHLISNGATLLAPSIDADTFERGVNTAVEPARKTIPISSRMSG